MSTIDPITDRIVNLYCGEDPANYDGLINGLNDLVHEPTTPDETRCEAALQRLAVVRLRGLAHQVERALAPVSGEGS